MAKKKSRKSSKAGVEELPQPPLVQGMKRKRISATGVAGGHPCPGESPSRKKKSLSQFASPSPNSKKRMQAAITAARETRRPMKKNCGDVQVPVPVLASSAFERVLALDAALRVATEARVNSGGNSPLLPSLVLSPQEHQSPTTTTTAQQQASVQASGVHVHIYVTPPEAPREVRQEQISMDPLVRAKRILDFPAATPLSKVADPGPKSSQDRSHLPVTLQTTVKQLPTLEALTLQTATNQETGGDLNALVSLSVPAAGVTGSNRRPPVTAGFATKGIDDGTAASPEGVNNNEVEEFPLRTARENDLNSQRYGEEQEIGRVALDPAIANYSREFVERLLSVLPPQERQAFLQTHPMSTPQNQLPRMPNEARAVELPHAEVAKFLGARFENQLASSPKSQVVLLSSTRSIDVQKENLVTEERFQKTLRELARDEKKYKKRQVKKLAKQEKGKEHAKATEKEVIGKSAATPKPPLTPGRLITSPVGPNSISRPLVKKDACHSSGASSGTPSSSAARNSVGEGDSVIVLSSWDAIQGILPFEVNSLTAPTSEFWEHMRRYALEQAPFEFPWHLDWNKQCLELKARFTLKLRKVYLGPWDPKSILRAIGANLRERRTRLKRKFEKCKKISQVSRPAGCSKGSWMIIYESTKDAKKQKKAKLCREAADLRFLVQGPTHCCGPRGLKGLHDRFVDYFNRPPIDEELDYGKMNGWADLKAKIEKALEVLHVGQGKSISPRGSPAIDPTPTDPPVEDQVKLSCSSGTSSSGTSGSSGSSENSSSNDDTSTSESEEE